MTVRLCNKMRSVMIQCFFEAKGERYFFSQTGSGGGIQNFGALQSLSKTKS